MSTKRHDFSPRSSGLPRLLLALGLVMSLLAACDDSPTTPDQPHAEVGISASPNPVDAVPSTVEGYTWRVTFTVTVWEAAGVGVTVARVSADVEESLDGNVVPVDGEVVQVSMTSASNRIEANGSSDFVFTLDYTLPGGGKEAIAIVALELTDDNGGFGTVSTQVDVNP